MSGRYEYKPGSKHPLEWIVCVRTGNGCPRNGEPKRVKAHGKGFCGKGCAQAGGNNSVWKGENAAYVAKHARVYRERGPALNCVWECADQKAYEWANLTGDYDDVWDFASMCKGCHQKYDVVRATMEEDFKGFNQGGRAKLTQDIVRKARQRRHAGEKLKDLAAEYNVANSTLSLAINRKQWRYV